MMKKLMIAAIGAMLMGPVAQAEPIHSPAPSGFSYNAQQIVDRMQQYLLNPAPYTGFFKGSTNTGRVASVGHCKSKLNGDTNCKLIGLPAGTNGTLMISMKGPKISMVTLAVHNTDPKYSALTTVACMLTEGALIQAVDPLANISGFASKTHEELLFEQLGPARGSINLNRDATDDGLHFEQRMYGSFFVVNVYPQKY